MAKIKPILFNTEMARATLENRKTVTRRVMKPQPSMPYCHEFDGEWFWTSKDADDDMMDWWPSYETGLRPPYQPGDILYVRETWGDYSECQPGGAGYYLYRADYPDGAEIDTSWDGVMYDLPRWRPSIHMPREAARIFLRVTDVGVERLQSMTISDIQAEGVVPDTVKGGQWQQLQRGYMKPAWDSTIKPADRAIYGWDANPWVWVIAFKRCEKPEERKMI